MSFVSRRALPHRVKVSIIKKPDNLQVFPEIIFGFFASDKKTSKWSKEISLM